MENNENKLKFIQSTLQDIYGLWWLKKEYLTMIEKSIKYLEEIKEKKDS